MASGEWFAMRPVIHGMCRYEGLLDGSLNLVDIVRMNDALDVKFENEARAAEAVKKD
jgi:hypothetical protein